MIIKNGEKIMAKNVRECKGFMKFMGLRFTNSFGPYDAYLFMGDNIMIDMFFVFHKILVLWLDKSKRVVDMKIASPFGVYGSSKESKYVLEVPVNTHVSISDKLVF